MVDRLPPTVEIGPYTYQVKRSPIPDSNECWGECDHHMREIRLGETSNPAQHSVTLIHEILHVVDLIYGTKITHKDLTKIANGLAQALHSTGFYPRELY